MPVMVLGPGKLEIQNLYFTGTTMKNQMMIWWSNSLTFLIDLWIYDLIVI